VCGFLHLPSHHDFQPALPSTVDANDPDIERLNQVSVGSIEPRHGLRKQHASRWGTALPQDAALPKGSAATTALRQLGPAALICSTHASAAKPHVTGVSIAAAVPLAALGLLNRGKTLCGGRF